MGKYHIELDVDDSIKNSDLIMKLNDIVTSMKEHIIGDMTFKHIDDNKINIIDEDKDNAILDKVVDILKMDLTSYSFSKDAKVDMNTTLQEDLGMDSLDIVEFVMKVEDAFEIVILDNDAYTWKTLGNVVKSIKEKGNHNG